MGCKSDWNDWWGLFHLYCVKQNCNLVFFVQINKNDGGVGTDDEDDDDDGDHGDDDDK
jgi:hypothetical protein